MGKKTKIIVKDFKKALDGACDIDVMTTDYYKFKAAVGGQNNRPKRKEQDNGYIIHLIR